MVVELSLGCQPQAFVHRVIKEPSRKTKRCKANVFNSLFLMLVSCRERQISLPGHFQN